MKTLHRHTASEGANDNLSIASKLPGCMMEETGPSIHMFEQLNQKLTK